MNMLLKRSLLLVLVFTLLLGCLAGCNQNLPAGGGESETGAPETETQTGTQTGTESDTEAVVYTLNLSADKTEAGRGDTVKLTAVLKAEGHDDIPSEDTEFILVSGSEYAAIALDELTVLSTAPDGATITVQAKEGASYSNSVTIKIRVPLKSIAISATTAAPMAGQSVAIAKVLDPSDATQTITWAITEGADYATMSGDVLMVKEDAPAGTVIKIKATCGDIESNELTFNVKSSEADVIKVTNITLSADSLNLLAGQSMIINSAVLPAEATEDIVLSIIEGEEYASLNGGVLVIKADAPTGATVKVVAKASAVSSEEIVFTVVDMSKPATSITVTAENLNPIAGHRVPISYTVVPEDTTDKLSWVIVEGGDIATMAGNSLVIDSAAPKDAVIKVKAVIGDIESNVLTFTVKPAREEIKVESITISANTSVLAGSNVVINKVVNPANADQPTEWRITEGGDYARMNGDTLMINSGVASGTIIKVKAVAGTVESNELIFTIQPTQEEINASKFFIELSKDSFVLDKKGTAAIPVLLATVYNYNYDIVEDKELEFKIVDGAQYLGINAVNNACNFIDQKGHGTAVIEVKIKGTDIVERAEVKVIVPPDAIRLPEVFTQRTDIEYAFSKLDHTFTVDTSSNSVTVTEAGASSLPFVTTPVGTASGGVCQDIKFTFAHEDGTTGDDVAVYENGKITFKKTGKVTVTVRSDSGSKVEASTSYKFNINEGYNVNTYEELSYIVRNTVYTGQQINFVVMDKPQGTSCTDPDCACGGYNYIHQYGYELVPATALKPKNGVHQTVYEILRGREEGVYNGMQSNRIQAVNKSLYINGNNHKVNASELRIFTAAEYEDYLLRTGGTDLKIPNVSSLISAEPWASSGAESGVVNKRDYTVNLYNLEVVGNNSYDYNPDLYDSDLAEYKSFGVIGACHYGISIGQREYDCHYYIDADNLTASGFANGMGFCGIVGNGKVSDLYVYNCYATGIALRSSIMTVENVKFGPCGATGMELAPEECNEAGLADNEVQQVTFLGTIDASANMNNGQTNYFNNYSIAGLGATIPQIINGNVAKYTEMLGATAVEHVRNTKGEFNFVALIFDDTSTLQANSSIVHYPDYQKGGIIDMTQLPSDGSVDTEHQFITMTIYITHPQLGEISVGKAMFFNHNYVKTVSEAE